VLDWRVIVVIIMAIALVLGHGVAFYTSRQLMLQRQIEQFAPRPAIVIINEDSVILRWDTHAEQLLGWTAREAVGRNLSIIMPDRYHHAHLKGILHLKVAPQDATDSDIINKLIKIEAIRKDHVEFPIYLLVFRSRDRRGNRTYVGRFWSTVDIEG
jgi:PAS domain S-box-containing protein